MKILLFYMPVIHRGYLDFLDRHKDAQTAFIFGQEIINKFDWLKRKEIRALSPEVAVQALVHVSPIGDVRVLDYEHAERLKSDSGLQLVFADEEESREVAKDLFEGSRVTFDRVFLRWDRRSISEERAVQAYPITEGEFHRQMMMEAELVSQRSPDWWRQVGAVLVLNNDRKLIAYNRHVPSDHTPYALGDPRNLLNKGVGVEVTSVLHSEAAVIAQAARAGTSTVGGRLYVTTFPCPYCANVIANSGISELYFREGYSTLEGSNLIEQAGIKIFRVE